MRMPPRRLTVLASIDVAGYTQCGSFSDSDGLCDVDRGQRRVGSAADGKVAHLALDAAFAAAVTAGCDVLIENFVEHSVMQGTALARGKVRGRRGVCGG